MHGESLQYMKYDSFLLMFLFSVWMYVCIVLSLKNWTKYFLNFLGRFEGYSDFYLDSDLEKLLLFWLLGSYPNCYCH